MNPSAAPEMLLGEALRARGRTISTAESCTGGLVLHRLTNVPGSSAWVMGGVVAYDNRIKRDLLQVRETTLLRHGAVSEETAREMALGARRLLVTDLAISITGIAGPGGGTAEKPVGLTWMALAGPDDLLLSEQHVHDGGRLDVKRASADAALTMILNCLNF
ncbi:MAG: CinA family protein [Anaerolineaceae bacterium]|nr:CinA family protein [Anaerolineaceae bacterium]